MLRQASRSGPVGRPASVSSGFLPQDSARGEVYSEHFYTNGRRMLLSILTNHRTDFRTFPRAVSYMVVTVQGFPPSRLCFVMPKIVVSPFRSTLSLPLLFVLGGLLVLGCSATAPVIQLVEGPDTLETKKTGTFQATLQNRQRADKPLTYTWRFGDGSTASRRKARPSYSSTGTYRVRFRAENEGGSDRRTLSVTVVPPPEPASITSINAKPNPVDEGKRVRFSSNVQGDAPPNAGGASEMGRAPRAVPPLTSTRRPGSTPSGLPPPTKWERTPAA